MNILDVFMLFVIYSFLGWVVETIYCSVLEGKFIYRGFLNGPVCPIYGFGALFILYFLNDLKAHPIILFLASILITSILEYITSYLLETIFNMKWWDYSNKRFHINGRICLLNSILFGILSFFLIEFIHPKVKVFLGGFSQELINLSSLLFFTYFLLDIIFTVVDLLNLKPYLKLFQEYESKYISREKFNVSRQKKRAKYRSFKSNLAKDIERKSEIHQALRSERIEDFKVNFSNRRMFQAYPGLDSHKHPNAIKRIRRHLRDLKEKDRKKK